MSSLFGRAIAAVRLRLQKLLQPPPVLQPAHGWLLPLSAHARARALESARAMAAGPARGWRR